MNLLQKYFKLLEMSTLNNFNQFLNTAYRKILEACLEDEAVETLKILENKEYLQLRINQLFSEIYVAEREKKIEELMDLVNSLQKGVLAECKTVEEKCKSCQILQKEIKQKDRYIDSLNKKLTQMADYEYKETKRIESLLLKQNQQLKKQIKQMQSELTQVLFEQNSQRELSLIQILRLKEQNKKEIQQKTKELQLLKKEISSKIDENKSLYSRLLQNAQKRENEQKQMREIVTQIKNLNLIKEKQQNEISILKNQQHLLEEKLNRLQMDYEFLKEKNKFLEKENKALKITNSDILSSHNLKDHSQIVNGSEQESSDLLSKVQNLNKINLELQRMNKNTKEEFQNKFKQLEEKNLFLQKNNFSLSEQMRKNQIKYDKDVRQLKQELKRINEQLSAQFQQIKQEQVETITKKHKIQLSQCNRQIQKLRQQNRSLTKTLVKAEQSFAEIVTEHLEQKSKLIEQVEKEKATNKEIKNHLNQEKKSTSFIQQESIQKYKELQLLTKEMKKKLQHREKEIKSLRKEVAKMVQEENSRSLLVENLKNKCLKFENNLDLSQVQVKKMKDQLKAKEKMIKEMQKKNQSILQEKGQIQNKCSNLNKNLQLAQLRAKRLSEELNQKKQLILSLQKDNQNQIMDIYEHTHIFASQNRKQIESYYMSLLKGQHQSKISSELKELNQAKQQEIQDLRTQKEQVQEKMIAWKNKYTQQMQQRLTFESKVIKLLDEIDKLRVQNTKLSEILRQQKRNTTGMVRAYQQKMIQYYNIFGEFKRQLYLNLKNQLTRVKQQLRQIVLFVQSQLQKSKQWISAYCFKLNQEVENLSTHFKLKNQKIKHQYDFGVVLKLQEKIREMKLQYDLKIKEKSMEFYTIIAEKEHTIAHKEQKQSQLHKKMSEIQIKNQQIQKIARQDYKRQEQMKEIINKMNNKVNQAEKQSCNLKNEVQYYRKENMELKKQMNSLETSFKEKLQKCRENYALQNDRLFAKYEKEFGRLIVSNKKGLQYTSLLSHSNSCNNMLIPTKGCQNDNKLQKIQKQIQQQKKKLNILEQGLQDKIKFDKTTKLMNKQPTKVKK